MRTGQRSVILLAWYFAVYAYGAHVVGPFATVEACEAERRSVRVLYTSRSTSNACWEGPKVDTR